MIVCHQDIARVSGAVTDTWSQITELGQRKVNRRGEWKRVGSRDHPTLVQELTMALGPSGVIGTIVG